MTNKKQLYYERNYRRLTDEERHIAKRKRKEPEDEEDGEEKEGEEGKGKEKRWRNISI